MLDEIITSYITNSIANTQELVNDTRGRLDGLEKNTVKLFSYLHNSINILTTEISTMNTNSAYVTSSMLAPIIEQQNTYIGQINELKSEIKNLTNIINSQNEKIDALNKRYDELKLIGDDYAVLKKHSTFGDFWFRVFHARQIHKMKLERIKAEEEAKRKEAERIAYEEEQKRIQLEEKRKKEEAAAEARRIKKLNEDREARERIQKILRMDK